MINTDLLSLVAVFGFGGAVFLSIFIYIILHPEILFSLWRQGAKVLYRLRLAKKQSAQEAIILGTLNTAISQLRSRAPGVFNHSARIKWIKNKDQFAEVKDGQVVLYVSGSHDEEKVLVACTMMYLKHGVIPEARPFVERRLVNAIDVSLAQTMLFGTKRAYEYLLETYVDPLLENSLEAKYFQLAETLKEAGVLTRIVLLEFGGLPNTLKGKSPTSRIRSETVYFVEFVERIVNRREEEMAQLRFSGRLFNTTVALVADPEQVLDNGIRFYQRKFRNDIESGTKTIHLLARGMRNVQLVRQIAQWAIQNHLIARVLISTYYEDSVKGEKIPASCITCTSSKANVQIGLTPVDEVYSVLADIVPEILDGRVDVVSVAREINVRTKIVVKTSAGGDSPVRYFIGPNGENVERLKALLSTTEEIDYINWTPSSADLIVHALYPLRPEEVQKVEVDKKTASATVYVKSSDLIGIAVGTHGVNKRLAEQVSNFRIQIEVDKQSSEEEILVKCKAHVSAISSGKVFVEKAVCLPGGIAKIAVSSETVPDPCSCCLQDCDLRMLSKALGVERVHFINWFDEKEKRIVSALYPLNSGEVLRVSFDAGNKVTVEVTTYEAQREAVGRNGNNVKAAEKLTGSKISIKLVDV